MSTRRFDRKGTIRGFDRIPKTNPGPQTGRNETQQQQALINGIQRDKNWLQEGSLTQEVYNSRVYNQLKMLSPEARETILSEDNELKDLYTNKEQQETEFETRKELRHF